MPIFSINFSRFFGAGSIFDEYRVLKLVVKVIPQYVPIEVGADINAFTPDSPYIVYSINDLDDISCHTINPEGHYLSSSGMPKSMVQGKPIIFTYSQPKEKKKFYINGGISTWPGTPATLVQSAVSTYPDPWGSLKLMFPSHITSAATSSAIARVFCEWQCMFRGLSDVVN
jgi:hypothetical protein